MDESEKGSEQTFFVPVGIFRITIPRSGSEKELMNGTAGVENLEETENANPQF